MLDLDHLVMTIRIKDGEIKGLQVENAQLRGLLEEIKAVEDKFSLICFLQREFNINAHRAMRVRERIVAESGLAKCQQIAARAKEEK